MNFANRIGECGRDRALCLSSSASQDRHKALSLQDGARRSHPDRDRHKALSLQDTGQGNADGPSLPDSVGKIH